MSINLFENEFTKGFAQLYSVQSDLVKQVTEANKKVALEVLKNTKTATDLLAKSLEENIRRLNNGY